MKIRKNKNNELVKYSRVPRRFRGKKLYMGGFDLLSEVELKAEGFYDLHTPTINADIQELGTIEFNAENDRYEYLIVDKTLDLDEVKESKFNELRSIVSRVHQAGNVYFESLRLKGEPIPEGVQTKINTFYTKRAEWGAFIEDATEAETLAQAKFPEVQIQNFIDQFLKL